MNVGPAPIVVVLAFLACVAVMPAWPWSRGWGPKPVLAMGLIFMFLAVFVAIGGFAPPP